MVEILKADLLPVLEQIEKEKGIPKEEILRVIEGALISAYKKHVGKNVNVEATVFPETSEVKAYVIKKIVEKVENPAMEITLEEARKVLPEAAVDTDLRIPLDTQEFSRIAAQAAKQVIMQKIRESERTSLYEEFKAKEGIVISGVVYKFVNNNIILDLGKLEGILPVREQVRRERFKIGEHIRALIVNVEKGPRGARVLLSRYRPELVLRLFELEVPEIYEKVVEVRKIEREAGARTKLAVISHNPKVDPVGACVGVNGSRVKPIIDELRGERIDLMPYSEDSQKFIAAAFSPAKVSRVNILDREKKSCEVIVPNDMLAFAIGKGGTNVNLVSRMTGWQIDVKSEAQKKEETETKAGMTVDQLSKLDGVGPKTAEVLFKAGWADINKLAFSSKDDLMTMQGIGERTAERIIESAKKYIEELPDEETEEVEEEIEVEVEEEVDAPEEESGETAGGKQEESAEQEAEETAGEEPGEEDGGEPEGQPSGTAGEDPGEKESAETAGEESGGPDTKKQDAAPAGDADKEEGKAGSGDGKDSGGNKQD